MNHFVEDIKLILSDARINLNSNIFNNMSDIITDNEINDLDFKNKKFIRNPKVMDFLDFIYKKKYPESTTLEEFLLDQFKEYLLERCSGFAFVKQECALELETINLVFYNYVLKSFILIDINTSTQIDTIKEKIKLFNKTEIMEEHNQAIGLLINTHNGRVTVQYTAYKEILPTEQEIIEEIIFLKQTAHYYLSGENYE